MNSPADHHDDDNDEQGEIFLDDSDIIHEVEMDEEGYFCPHSLYFLSFCLLIWVGSSINDFD